MSIAVKICGVTTPAAVDTAVMAGAVYGGVVSHPKSPRFVGLEQARLLAQRMRGRLKVVSLVADLDDSSLEVLVKMIEPDFLQLHGQETVKRTAEIRSRFGLPVIKALSVAEAQDLVEAADYENVADMLMFDAKPPKGAERGGGHGAAFDWKILRGHNFSKPWFLAGGLSPENVGRAICLSGASQVDVSSGVEIAPGIKDPTRIAEFITATKKAFLSVQSA